MDFVTFGINIRNHRVTEAEIFFRDESRTVHEYPRFFSERFSFGAMESHYRRKRAVLNTSHVKFVIRFAAEMSAYVVAPPGIADVRCGSGEVREIIQSSVRNRRIAGKTYRISVRTYLAVSRKYKRIFVIYRIVEIMIVI